MAQRVAVGVGRLVVDAVVGVTGVVESMHGSIARGKRASHTRGVTRLVYQTIRGVTRVVGGGLELALPLVPDLPPSQLREELHSVLNGIIGHHLAATANPLAIAMEFRDRERAVVTSVASRRLVVMIHGLCMSDSGWRRRGQDHGAALGDALYLRYNSGRRVCENGRELAERLEALVAASPALEDLVLVGHSMGGLVARSACHHARAAGHAWPARLSSLVFLGTPHHGAPLERAGAWFDAALEWHPYAAPLARIGKNRSAGIIDLRHGAVIEDARCLVPLPDGVPCYAVAARADLLVPLASALGRELALDPDRCHVIDGIGHMDLLDSTEVTSKLLEWLR